MSDTVMVHGAMNYKCESCGKEWRMWLEVGVEGKNQLMPCPFMITCKCGGSACHIDWHKEYSSARAATAGRKYELFQARPERLEA